MKMWIYDELIERLEKLPIFPNGKQGLSIEVRANYLLREAIDHNEEIEPNYQRFNDILGAMEGAKLEFYRRKVIPYEDEKIKLNGDV